MKINGFEVCQTNYSHPDITTGMHTNGKPATFIKIKGEWVRTDIRHMHIIKQILDLCDTEEDVMILLKDFEGLS
jgi:hypothetical protein